MQSLFKQQVRTWLGVAFILSVGIGAAYLIIDVAHSDLGTYSYDSMLVNSILVG